MYDYRLEVKHHNEIKTLSFLGVLINNKMLIVGTENHSETLNFINNLQQINNEQSNQIRHLLKEQNDKINNKNEETETLLEELSRVNNELVNLHRDLHLKNAELERLNEIKNQFMGMAAHDLRSPLGNINSISEFLEKRSENLTDTQKRFVNHIKEQSSFMLHLVNELLDVSAIESGQVQLNKTSEDITRLIENNINLNKGLAEKKNINIHFSTKLDTLYLQVDKNKIEQVLTNLLTNAIKYSNPDTEISVHLEKKDNHALIEVKDQGLGIKQAEISSLFKPFQKTSTASTQGEKSTGLGLYITKRIVEAHNGTIKVESKVGVGSSFIITLLIPEK